METWKEKNKDFEYKLWTEKEIDSLNLVNKDAYDTLYANRMFCGAADVVRVEILYRFGGIYIDADCECVKELRDAEFIKQECFFVPMSDKSHKISNGIIGITKEHSYMNEYMKAIAKVKEFDPPWATIGPVLFTKIVGLKNPNVIPAKTFLPIHYSGYESSGDCDIYSIHHWGSTRRKYKNK
jgi:mannosyltransferase OCH1-like enzyme